MQSRSGGGSAGGVTVHKFAGLGFTTRRALTVARQTWSCNGATYHAYRDYVSACKVYGFPVDQPTGLMRSDHVLGAEVRSLLDLVCCDRWPLFSLRSAWVCMSHST